MPLIRPEARKTLWQWREVLAGAVLLALGSWWLYRQIGLMFYVGSAVAMIGAALLIAGLQRSRFRSRADGPGAVDVDEGQITYFGPLSGGAVAIGELRELALLRSGQSPHWRLTTRDTVLFIPVNAAGTDDLFDAFTTLRGLRTERMLGALREDGAHDTVIWQHTDDGRGPARLH